MSSSISSALSSLQNLRQQLFTQSDTDKSGNLNLAEFKKMSSAMGAEGLAALGNKDQTAEQTFKALDTNGDGKLTQTEVESGARLSDQISSTLLKIQEIKNGGLLLSALNGDDTDLASLFSGSDNPSTSLTALLSRSTNGENSTSILQALLKSASDGGSNTDSSLSSYIQQILANYKATESATTGTETKSTTTAITA